MGKWVNCLCPFILLSLGFLGHRGRMRSLRVGPPPPIGSSQGMVGRGNPSIPLNLLRNYPILFPPNSKMELVPKYLFSLGFLRRTKVFGEFGRWVEVENRKFGGFREHRGRKRDEKSISQNT